MEKLGIENLKKAAKTVIKLSESIEKAADDGKVTLAEALGVGVSNFAGIVGVFKNGKEIAREFKDLSQAERDELISYVKQEFDLENDNIEEIVEQAFVTANEVANLVNVIKN